MSSAAVWTTGSGAPATTAAGVARRSQRRTVGPHATKSSSACAPKHVLASVSGSASDAAEPHGADRGTRAGAQVPEAHGVVVVARRRQQIAVRRRHHVLHCAAAGRNVLLRFAHRKRKRKRKRERKKEKRKRRQSISHKKSEERNDIRTRPVSHTRTAKGNMTTLMLHSASTTQAIRAKGRGCSSFHIFFTPFVSFFFFGE